ncbi:MAG TPA: DNA methyltransferase [Nevskia sp.]|nr:DNA methyltransferase [Nevskia sp.]
MRRGRPRGTGHYGERTVAVRVPVSALAAVEALIAPLRETRRQPDTQTLPRKKADSRQALIAALRARINEQHSTLLPPIDALVALELIHKAGLRAAACIIDPWYSTRTTRQRPSASVASYLRLISAASRVADHVFVWGRSEDLARHVDRLPSGLHLRQWLVWHYRNCPSRSRGWRPSHQSCLHLAHRSAAIHPHRFLTDAQRELLRAGKLRYFPGPPDVIDSPLITGWSGRNEATGHPSQKPLAVIRQLLRMTCAEGDWVVDVTAGGGTTGAAAESLGVRWMLSDRVPSYVRTIEERLATRRLRVPASDALLKS